MAVHPFLPAPVHCQVGENQDSVKYVNKKEKAAQACGMNSRLIRLPATASETEIIAAVKSLDTGLLTRLRVCLHRLWRN